MSNPIYLDNNSTTPVDERVLKEMIPYFTKFFGNASSKQHSFGWIAEDAVQLARERVKVLLDADPEDTLVFTSGATESINMILRGIYKNYGHLQKQIISCKTEHSAVLETLQDLELQGAKIRYIPVLPSGLVDLNALEEVLKTPSILVVIMTANNETGVIQPIEDIVKLSHSAGAYVFSDATQSFGKVKLSVKETGLDFLACSSHKIFGPKGIGGLFIKKKRPEIKIHPLITGGGQENELRGGTLNVPGIVGFGKAADLARQFRDQEGPKIEKWRNDLEKKLLEIPFSYINGHSSPRLPHVTNLRFDYIQASQLLALLPEIAFSTGSACNSSRPEPSHVLLNMGLNKIEAKSSFRLALGRMNTEEEIQLASQRIEQAIVKLRIEHPKWKKSEIKTLLDD